MCYLLNKLIYKWIFIKCSCILKSNVIYSNFSGEGPKYQKIILL